jgi:hypothetical protein
MTSAPTVPKVFVSHASEDKQRFVVDFARRLRENGVDAWLDQWEMQPGDSLVDRIFEQGLKQAQAVVIVLSAASVQKPWVREELNLSVVKKITKGIKLIPVVIDQCDIPESLQSTIWQRIDDLGSYEAEFQRILDVIFDRSGKPALGERPPRFAAAEPVIATLTQTDERVFREIARHEIDLQEGAVALAQLRETPDLAAISVEELAESLLILAQQALVTAEGIDPTLGYFRLTLTGFRQYAEAFIDDYKSAVARISALLVNEGVYENHELAARSGKPLAFVNFVLDVLDDADQIIVSKYGSGLWEVVRVLPSLKRSLA